MATSVTSWPSTVRPRQLFNMAVVILMALLPPQSAWAQAGTAHERHWQAGLDALDRGDAGRVLREYSAAHKLLSNKTRSSGDDPDLGNSYRRLGRIYSIIGEYEKSVESYMLALKIWDRISSTADQSEKPLVESVKVDIHRSIGRVFEDRGQFELARSQYEIALSLLRAAFPNLVAGTKVAKDAEDIKRRLSQPMTKAPEFQSHLDGPYFRLTFPKGWRLKDANLVPTVAENHTRFELIGPDHHLVYVVGIKVAFGPSALHTIEELKRIRDDVVRTQIARRHMNFADSAEVYDKTLRMIKMSRLGLREYFYAPSQADRSGKLFFATKGFRNDSGVVMLVVYLHRAEDAPVAEDVVEHIAEHLALLQ